MVSMTRPLVQGHASPTKVIESAAAFFAGAILSAGLVGTILTGIAIALHPLVTARVGWSVLAATAMVLALADVGIGRLWTPSLRRQTNPLWWRTLGPPGVWFAWGLDLGSGFSTIRVTSLVWIVYVAILLILPPPWGIATMGLYAIGLSTAIAITAASIWSPSRPLDAETRIFQLGKGFQLASVGLLTCLTIWAVVGAVAA